MKQDIEMKRQNEAAQNLSLVENAKPKLHTSEVKLKCLPNTRREDKGEQTKIMNQLISIVWMVIDILYEHSNLTNQSKLLYIWNQLMKNLKVEFIM